MNNDELKTNAETEQIGHKARTIILCLGAPRRSPIRYADNITPFEIVLRSGDGILMTLGGQTVFEESDNQVESYVPGKWEERLKEIHVTALRNQEQQKQDAEDAIRRHDRGDESALRQRWGL